MVDKDNVKDVDPKIKIGIEQMALSEHASGLIKTFQSSRLSRKMQIHCGGHFNSLKRN